MEGGFTGSVSNFVYIISPSLGTFPFMHNLDSRHFREYLYFYICIIKTVTMLNISINTWVGN